MKDYSKEIRENLKAEVKFEDKGEEKVYQTMVQEVSPHRIGFSMPMEKGVLIPIPVGKYVEITVFKENVLYYFTGEVISRTSSPIPMFYVPFPKRIHRIQRRRYFRLEFTTKIKVRFLDESLNPQSEPEEVIMRNLSGGGVLLVGKKPVEKGQLLEITLPIHGTDIIVIGKVVLCRKSAEDVYYWHVEFVVIEESLREKIISFIFEKQREMRYKGLL